MARSQRSQALLQFGLFCGILLFVNVLANVFFTHFDLTEEKRFTLTEPTRELIRGLDDQVYVEVLLGGDFPAGIRRLQQATREMLDDFRGLNGYIDYEFTDPTQGTPEQVQEKEKAFRDMGISAVTVSINKDGEQTFKAAFPFAIVHYRNRQQVVRLAENPTPDTDPEVVMNNAVSTLEYRLASAIKKIQTNVRSMILFTEGHGELDELQTADLELSLRSSYDVDRINLDSVVSIDPSLCKLLVVAKPLGAFSEKDKFKIDQFVMGGGRVLWLIDRMNATLDSMRYTRAFIPMDYPLNLEDMLFKYGARIQPDLVLDWDCAKIELVTGQYGGSPQFTAVPWVYFPTVTPASGHPIVKSLDRVFLRFCSSIDTIRTKTPVKKTLLLRTSPRSRLQFSPVQLSFDFLKTPDNPENYNKGSQTVGVLLEGVFPSNYENRVSEEMLGGLKQMGLEYRDKSVPTSMIVISDGDVALNPVQDREKKKFGPLGFNPYVQRRSELVVYANKDLLLNAIEYLVDPSGIIEARTREVKLRKLDAVRPRAEKAQWQLFNIGMPLVLLGLFALIFSKLRKRRYA